LATPKKTEQGTWRVQLEIGGVRDAGTFKTKRDADEWNARRTLELRSAGKAGPGANKTLLETLRRYADEVSPTKRGSAKELIRLKAFESQPLPLKKRVADVTSDDIGKWRDARLKVNARGSVLRDLGLLSAVMTQARKEWKWIKVNPVSDVTKPANPDHRERIISGVEIRKMLRQLGHGGPVRSVSQAVAACFLATLTTGMRAGELCGLRWEDVRGDHVRLRTTKTKPRMVPLSGTAQRVIERMKGWDKEMVFGVESQSLDALFRKARKRASLEGFTFHDGRHTAATAMAGRMKSAGIPAQQAVFDFCRIFGWTKIDNALVYFNTTASEIARRIA